MALHRFLLLASAYCFVTACGEKMDWRQTTVRSIESAVVLPKEASSLESYERYYAQDARGTVFGVYTNHDAEFRRIVREACEGLSEKPFPCPTSDERLRFVNAGESVWLNETAELPMMSGGGCAEVNIEYEPAKKQFVRVVCNGPY